MTPEAIIEQVTEDGVRLILIPNGKIKGSDASNDKSDFLATFTKEPSWEDFPENRYHRYWDGVEEQG